MPAVIDHNTLSEVALFRGLTLAQLARLNGLLRRKTLINPQGGYMNQLSFTIFTRRGFGIPRRRVLLGAAMVLTFSLAERNEVVSGVCLVDR